MGNEQSCGNKYHSCLVSQCFGVLMCLFRKNMEISGGIKGGLKIILKMQSKFEDVRLKDVKIKK